MAVDEATRRGYLQQAYRLGHEFESSLVPTEAPALTGSRLVHIEPDPIEGGTR
jgi:hypothetical protein